MKQTDAPNNLRALMCACKCSYAEARREFYSSVVLSQPHQAIQYFNSVCHHSAPLPTLPAHGLFTRKLTIQFPICNTNASEQFQFFWDQFQATLQYLQNLDVFDFAFSHNNKDSLVLIASISAQFPSTLKTIQMTAVKGERNIMVSYSFYQ